MNQLGILDASFLEIEDSVSHMHIGAVAIFGRAGSRYRRFAVVLDPHPGRGTRSGYKVRPNRDG